MSSTTTSWTTQGTTKAGASSTSSDSLVTGTLTADTIQLASNVIKASDGDAAITLNTSSDVIIAGDLTVTGNTITFGNGEIINNASDNIISFTTGTILLSSASSEAALQLRPGTNGDALINFFERQVGGTCSWTIGNDGASSDVLKFDAGTATVGAATKFSLTQAGDMTIEGDLTVNGGDITVNNMTSSGFIRCVGTEGNAAAIELWADEGDDNADKWQMEAAADNKLYFYSFTSGSWVSQFTVTSVGDCTAARHLYTGGNIHLHGGDILNSSAEVCLSIDSDQGVTAIGGYLTLGVTDTTRGVIKLNRGSTSSSPGYIALAQPDGTLKYLSVTDAGNLVIGTGVPDGTGDTIVGGQTA